MIYKFLDKILLDFRILNLKKNQMVESAVQDSSSLNPNLAIRQYLEQHNITGSLLEVLQEMT